MRARTAGRVSLSRMQEERRDSRAHATGHCVRSIAEMIRAHSDVLLLVHVVFSTVGRRRLLPPSMDAWLHTELRYIARRSNIELLGIGNADDHVHVVLNLRATNSLSVVVKQLKGASSHEWNQQHRSKPMHWQAGYWARAVEPTSLARLLPYLRNQRTRHGSGTIEPAFEQNEATDPEATSDQRDN